MNLRQLEALRAVVDSGTVTRAAETMRISQPAVSKLLGNLSRDCGFELFRRHGNRVIPTAEALTLYREVERMFVSVEHVSRLAAGIRELRSGQLAIAAFPALATRPLPRIITRFLRQRADVHISTSGHSGRTLVEWVAANQADLGIGLLLLEHSGVDYQSAGSVDGVCVLHPSHPLARRKVVHARDLQDLPFISLGAADRSRFRVDQAFEAERVRRRVTMEAQQSESACTFAAEGAGIAVVEPFSASEFSRDRLAVRPFRPRVRFDLWLMTPAQRPRSLLVEEFIKFFRASIASLVSPEHESTVKIR